MDPVIRSWLRERDPALPDPFMAILLAGDTSDEVPGSSHPPMSPDGSGGSTPPPLSGEALAKRLTEAALSALRQAAAQPGRTRPSAFHLLAGDALLTYACEAALSVEDVAGALGAMITRVGNGLAE